MNKIVLTSSATWLFEVIKNVTSSNVPEKKMDPKAEQSPQSQGHRSLPTGAKYPGSAPAPRPLQSRLGSMLFFGCSP